MYFQEKYFGVSERTSRQAQRSDVFKFEVDRGYDNYFGSNARGDQEEDEEDVYRYAGILAPAGPAGNNEQAKGQLCGSSAECGTNCHGCCSVSRCIAEKGNR